MQWTTESLRASPGARLRRVGPAPPMQEENARWARIAGHLVTITRAIEGTAGENVHLATPGTTFLTRYVELAQKAAVLCEEEEPALESGDARPPSGRWARVREEMRAAYERMEADFAQQRGAGVAVSGELLVESRQLLRELAPRTRAEERQEECA